MPHLYRRLIGDANVRCKSTSNPTQLASTEDQSEHCYSLWLESHIVGFPHLDHCMVVELQLPFCEEF